MEKKQTQALYSELSEDFKRDLGRLLASVDQRWDKFCQEQLEAGTVLGERAKDAFVVSLIRGCAD